MTRAMIPRPAGRNIPQQKVVATVKIPIPRNLSAGGSLPSPTGAALSPEGISFT
jgi:hypothetical protein